MTVAAPPKIAPGLRGFVAFCALIVVIAIALIALLAPLIAPQNPYDLASLVLMDARRPPGFVGSGGYVHILGTDAQGRDLFSAILYGLRISIQIGVAAGTVAAIALPYAGPLANTSPGVSTPRMWRSLPWSCETSE